MQLSSLALALQARLFAEPAPCAEGRPSPHGSGSCDSDLTFGVRDPNRQ